jgi:quercetin dioxygenase-like cupin family protein
MAQIFDLKTMTAHPYEQREKNVFFQAKEFKARLIELPPGGEIPPCEMSSYVVFCVIAGSTEIVVEGEKFTLKEGQCLITEPATLTMHTVDGVKILGIQIEKA